MAEQTVLSPDDQVELGDPRYPSLSRGFNQRWIADPDAIMVVGTPEEARAALAAALEKTGRGEAGRITVRSGGHCYEDFVCSPDVGVIIDVSPMCKVYYDPGEKAHCVEAGATNWHVYSHLYPATGRALPGGSCYSVGLGGHITGGGFGLMSRQFGLTVDYLYAVEVAVVRKDYTVELVTARRDDTDPKARALWWAHTGGGGGNFGVVTRFWFRDVPEPPSEVLLCSLAWDWKDFHGKKDLHALLTAFGVYFRDHQDPETPEGRLFAMLKLNHVSNGQIGLLAQVDADVEGAQRAMDGFIAAVDGSIRPTATEPRTSMGEHPPVARMKKPRRMPWLAATQTLNGSGENQCGKYKSAYIRRPFTDAQIDAMWDHLGKKHFLPEDYDNPEARIQIDSYGSAINIPERRHPATAVPQRDSIMKMQYQVYWFPGDENEQKHIDWIQQTYQATFADTGGVPKTYSGSGDHNTDGCYINYPDGDLPEAAADGGTEPWPVLYYKAAYPMLQQVKADWDPNNVFRHRQSIRPKNA
ncbi:FAD-dependent oxidoreductase [Nocardiopsis composta]|uniref:FAD/FMN-containing dehydrogenase n=1 Tax=Nocardiopsis composta TaxID=157465 RepID=A0A7W8QI05_9ACTN|nr:BBE domain-containing protein [Nocardiopsis composta]MBB5430579.1 FAD/FMN-containing dehydrogenase [Nocardiopsis composta]